MGAAAPPAAAQPSVYTGLGIPGLKLGAAWRVNDHFGLRADLLSLGSHSRAREEAGIDYRGTLRLQRAGLFADGFVFGGGLRLSAGLTINRHRLALRAAGDGSPIEIGDTLYPTSADDRFAVRLAMPRVTPYVGIGWGPASPAKGLGLIADAGVSIGRPRLRARASGPNLGAVLPQDIDAELAQLRRGVGDVRFVPQLTVGLVWRF